MKTKTILFSLIAVLAITAIVFQSCKKENTEELPPDDDNEIIIAENTVVVDSTILTNLVVAGTMYTYHISGNQPNISIGDILIGENNGGYLRKVVSLNIAGEELQIETEDAKIVEAILNGDFQQNIQLQISSKKVDNLFEETYLVSTAEGVSVKGNVIDLDGVVLYNGNIGGVDVELTLPEGSISFEPEIDFGFKIRNGSFKELHAYAEGNIDMRFKALLQANGEFNTNDEINLATFKTYKVEWVGVPPLIIPVYEVFTLKFDAGFVTTNEIHGEVETGFTSNYSIRYGYLYTKANGWEQIWDTSANFQHYPVQGLFNANLGLEVYIKPSLTIEFYGAVGPGMDVRPYLDFTAEAHNKDIYWNWELSGGIDGYLLFNAHIFDWQIINYSEELFDWHKVIASDYGIIGENQPPIASFTVSPSSGTTSTIFAFNASGSTDNEDPTSDLQVRWDFDGNGSWDTNWDTDKTQNHQYSSEATYTAKLEVKDTEGLTDQYTKSITVSNGGSNTPPTALFTVSPSSGTTSTNFIFDASGSFDNEDPTSDLQVRWDFDGDGSWDTGWDYDKTQNHQYSSEAIYTAKLEVKDTEELTDQYNKSITVSNGGGGTGTFTDPRDGQTYATIEIGNQTWFAENLNYQTTNSWWYENSSANGDVYGRLYTWESALTACPSGWSLPSDDEWKTMEMALGMSQSEADDIGYRGTDEGGKMKETGTTHWNSPNTGATNTSGFTALPGGGRYGGGAFHDLGRNGFWWSSSEGSGTGAWGRALFYYSDQVGRYDDGKAYGFSVRCLKD